MKIVDQDGSGKVTKQELIVTFERLAHLVDYDMTIQDEGQLGYLWSIMDVDHEGVLNYNQVEEIIKNLSLTDIIRDYG